MSPARIITAFLGAPLMTPVVLLAADHLKGKPFNLVTDLGLFVFLAVFAYMATALFGVPAFYLFRIKQWTNILLYVLAGVLIGLIVSVMLNAWLSSFDSLDFGIHLSRMLAGGASAFMFRMVSGGKFDVSSALSHGET